MDVQRFAIGDEVFNKDDPVLQIVLEKNYPDGLKPKCMCVRGGVAMYVAKYGEYLVKRLPDTGPLHHASCPSFELGADESGLGKLLGEAIVEVEGGMEEVSVNFSMTRRLGKDFPKLKDDKLPPAEMKLPRMLASLRSLIHRVWENAKFNQWYPNMGGKRNYYVLRKYLLEAAKKIKIKGMVLQECLYIPEEYKPGDAKEITQRRKVLFLQLHSPDEDVQFKKMIMVGELKEIRTLDTGGYAFIVKHVPDCQFLVDEKSLDRIVKKYEEEIDMFHTRKGEIKLIVACVFYARRENIYQIDTVYLMMVTPTWIPINHGHEADLVGKLVSDKRTFIKPLQYEENNPGKFANLVLRDAGVKSMNLHVTSSFMNEKELASKQKLIHTEGATSWHWDASAEAVPPDLPKIVERKTSHQQTEKLEA